MYLTLPQARVLFRGDRLTEARLARGLKKVDVAKEGGITPAAVGQYERGDIRPSAEVLSHLSSVLEFPAGFFVTGPAAIDLSEDRIHFRSLRSTSSRVRSKQIARLALLEEIVGHLERKVMFPSITIEQYPLVTTDRTKIEAIAEAVRQAWGIGDGPITNIVMLIEGVGCVVTRSQADAQGIDAYSRSSPDRPIAARLARRCCCFWRRRAGRVPRLSSRLPAGSEVPERPPLPRSAPTCPRRGPPSRSRHLRDVQQPANF